jgi:hypothetical protein
MSQRTIFRLYPDYQHARGLLLDEASSVRVLRRQRTGAGEVGRLAGIWTAESDVPLGDFPCGMGFAPILSRRICTQFETELAKAGECIPVHADGLEDGAYQLYLVNPVIDCLDVKRSAKPKRETGEMTHVTFLPSKIDSSLPAFRIPQSPTFVFWNEDFVHALERSGAEGLTFLVVWSEDHAIQPASAPMR